MRKIVPIFILFLVAAVSAQTSEKIEGYWQGAIEKDGKIWRVGFEIEKAGEGFRAVADFIDAHGFGLEFSVKKDGETYRLERPQPNGTAIVFEGKVEGENFKGNWSGLNTTARFELKRGKAPPKYYREEEVTFRHGDVTLSGTLLVPLGRKRSGAVVITHGSGPATRASYRSWGMEFVRQGIAALVYDKRGNGKSTGDWRSASMEDLARDALAGVELLKRRADIDESLIAVAGHSQGSWIAPLTATLSKDVSFVIASAASGVGPDRQSIYHRANVMREMGFSEADVKTASDLREKLYASGRLLFENDPRAKEERRKVSAELEKYRDEPWFEKGAELPPNLDNDNPPRGALELLFFEPSPMWEKVKVPVLLIWGDRDTVVPVSEGKKIIENALEKSGNKRVEVKIVPNVDHAGIVVKQTNEWDFPRVDLSYWEATAAWLAKEMNI
jgi:pimeloyl-ACP methyl ester carboxylesterase